MYSLLTVPTVFPGFLNERAIANLSLGLLVAYACYRFPRRLDFHDYNRQFNFLELKAFFFIIMYLLELDLSINHKRGGKECRLTR